MKIIQTDNAPKAIGPYSQAIINNDLLFCSGQIGLHPDTGELANGLESQTNQILANIEAILTESGTTKSSVIKTTIFLTDIAAFPTVNEIYGEFFGDHKPARSTIAVAALPKGALVEIEVIANIK